MDCIIGSILIGCITLLYDNWAALDGELLKDGREKYWHPSLHERCISHANMKSSKDHQGHRSGGPHSLCGKWWWGIKSQDAHFQESFFPQGVKSGGVRSHTSTYTLDSLLSVIIAFCEKYITDYTALSSKIELIRQIGLGERVLFAGWIWNSCWTCEECLKKS